MGSSSFVQKAKGTSVNDAFYNGRDQAAWEYGHGGYTGTLAEKSEFVIIELPLGKEPEAFAEELMGDDDPRIQDKWGPAGAIDCGNGEWLFFGYASS